MQKEVNLFGHEQMKNFFLDITEPDLDFDRNKAVYVGDVSHAECHSQNDQK